MGSCERQNVVSHDQAGGQPMVAKYLEAGQIMGNMLHDPAWLGPCLQRYKLKKIDKVRSRPNKE